jgi:hypothetical protein
MKHKPPHKVTRVNIGRRQDYPIYKCTLSGCNHNVIPELLLGRETLCNECEIPFVVTYKDLVVKPKCPTCKKKEEVDLGEVEEVIERLKNG